MANLVALFSIVGLSLAVSFGLALVYRFMVDQDRMREIKAEMASIRKKMSEAKKAKNEKEMKELMEKSLKMGNQQMKMNMKPLIVSMVIAFAVLPVLPILAQGALFKLPFWMPILGPDVGWLGLYIIISLPSTIFFRKLLGVD